MTQAPFSRRALAILLALPLVACGETGADVRSASFTPASRPAAQGLVGSDARGLLRQFGTPRLDIRDPAARKLQFGNGRCVLDVYLYPPAANREPLVTYAEARTPQGVDMDANACARALREGQQP